ncbi:hypothetical protein WMF11_16200 [Sorangium sp. So ce295]|uniref:hypothetical protein n=1 Tax=Sorangium sp. So ce295 TaxID=3133295 RepID=UPI003F629AD7
MLQRLDGLKELLLEQPPELQVICRLPGRVPFGRNPLLELLDEPLPVMNRLEMIETLRKIH